MRQVVSSSPFRHGFDEQGHGGLEDNEDASPLSVVGGEPPRGALARCSGGEEEITRMTTQNFLTSADRTPDRPAPHEPRMIGR